jgi:PAT family beta-lactamase induction signal transducer AmpG
VADGIVALARASSASGSAAGWRPSGAGLITLAIGAIFAALGNFGFAWLAHQAGPVLFHRFEWRSPLYFATAMAVDQFGNGFAGAVFVVYLSMLVNPRFPGAQYALLSGFAFLLPRLLPGAGGRSSRRRIGYDGFFLMPRA